MHRTNSALSGQNTLCFERMWQSGVIHKSELTVHVAPMRHRRLTSGADLPPIIYLYLSAYCMRGYLKCVFQNVIRILEGYRTKQQPDRI
jgi:hypothetical protein